MSVYIHNIHMFVCIYQYTHIYIFRFSSKHLKSLRKKRYINICVNVLSTLQQNSLSVCKVYAFKVVEADSDRIFYQVVP